jgi:hypothetical protein
MYIYNYTNPCTGEFLTPIQVLVLENLQNIDGDPVQTDPSGEETEETPDKHRLNYYELFYTNGEELTLNELQSLNQMGYVYHSEIKDVSFENEDGSISYMNIYRFAQAESRNKLFNDILTWI